MALIVATIILCDRSCREAVFVMVVGGEGDVTGVMWGEREEEEGWRSKVGRTSTVPSLMPTAVESLMPPDGFIDSSIKLEFQLPLNWPFQ